MLVVPADLQKSTMKPARCIILGTVTASINDKEAGFQSSLWTAVSACGLQVGGMIPPVADLGGLEGTVLQKPGIPARTTVSYGWF